MAKVTKSATAPAPAAPAEQATTTATPTAPAAPMAPPKVPKVAKEPDGTDVFERTMVDGKGAPLTHKNAKGEVVPWNTPQVKVIANLLEASPSNRLTRKDLIAALPAAGLVTRQPVGRIVSYYTKDMVEAGIIKVLKSTPAAESAGAAA